MNKNYGKLADGQIVYAPAALTEEGAVKVNPSAASYLEAGWKKVVDEPPEPEARMDVMLSSWTETDDKLTAIYKQVPHIHPVVSEGDNSSDASLQKGKRIFSKLKLVATLKEADMWVLVKTWLEEKAYYDYYLAAQDFVEDHPLFVEGKTAIQKYLNLTDTQIEAILEKCVANA